MKNLIKKIITILGFIFLGIGIIGIFLPILPTVPLLLAAAACFMRSSPHFYAWFCSTKIYKKELESFDKSRSMTRRKKIKALGIMTIMMLYQAVKIKSIYGKGIIISILIFNYIYFHFFIKTKKQGEDEDEGKTGSENN